jgi:hypothetical protein
MKMMLSIPSTISNNVSVVRLIQISGCVIHSITGGILGKCRRKSKPLAVESLLEIVEPSRVAVLNKEKRPKANLWPDE